MHKFCLHRSQNNFAEQNVSSYLNQHDIILHVCHEKQVNSGYVNKKLKAVDAIKAEQPENVFDVSKTIVKF